MLLLIELQIRRGRKVWTQVRTVNKTAELQTANVAYFQRKIGIFRLSVWLGVPINPDKRISTVFCLEPLELVLTNSQVIFNAVLFYHSPSAQLFVTFDQRLRLRVPTINL